jgi:hypothetical protein
VGFNVAIIITKLAGTGIVLVTPVGRKLMQAPEWKRQQKQFRIISHVLVLQ